MTLANYYTAAFTEPGYLPRGTPSETSYLEKRDNITIDLAGDYYPEPKGKVVLINKIPYELKFCVRKILFLISGGTLASRVEKKRLLDVSNNKLCLNFLCLVN